MKKTFIFIFTLILSHAWATDDNWRVEVKVENDLDTMRVYETSKNQKAILTVKAVAPSQGFISTDEVYIRSVKKKFLLTRWVFGAVGSETIKIYDPASGSQKEVYKLQSMPPDVKINGNGITFTIRTGPGTSTSTEWIAK